jgi:excisionase family DNA binding protein
LSQDLFSVGDVATRLNLHVKTVRRYVRDGQLKATRIGKQYRIARVDLEAFTGQPVPLTDAESVGRKRQVGVASTVQIDAIDADAATRLTQHLLSAAGSPAGEASPLRIDTMYDPARGQLRVTVGGSIQATSYVLLMIAMQLEPS